MDLVSPGLLIEEFIVGNEVGWLVFFKKFAYRIPRQFEGHVCYLGRQKTEVFSLAVVYSFPFFCSYISHRERKEYLSNEICCRQFACYISLA